MRRKLLPLFSLSLTLSMPFPVLALGMMGNGDMKTELRSTAAFHAIDMAGVGKLHVERGPSPRVEVRLDSNLLSHYVSESRDGILRLGFEPGFAVGRVTDLEVKVTIPELDRLSLSGATEAEIGKGFSGGALAVKISGAGSIKGTIDYSSLRTDISGAGNAVFTGKASSLRVGISGSGDFNGKDLALDEATIEVSGSGEVQIRAKRHLEVSVSGAGSVRYWGDPVVKQRISGAGSVKRVGGL
ncbi:MAG: head GIN domain-containing protein [Spirochaetota bacterium]